VREGSKGIRADDHHIWPTSKERMEHGNGQVPSAAACPRSGLAYPLFTPETIGHTLTCPLAVALLEVGSTRSCAATFTPTWPLNRA
jgi:hypothetical protein